MKTELLNPQNSAVIFIDFQPQMVFGVASIVGHGIGLMVAYAYAAQFPQTTERVVLMDAFLPVSLLVPWLLNPLVSGLPVPLQALCMAVGIVILLTWAVMPLLVRILSPWVQFRL